MIEILLTDTVPCTFNGKMWNTNIALNVSISNALLGTYIQVSFLSPVQCVSGVFILSGQHVFEPSVIQQANHDI